MSKKDKKILAIIPARGGSKGIPRKNIKLLMGKPLIAYTIEAAKKSKYLDRVIVSTDSPEIAKVAKKYGAEVPFIRPAKYATDTASTESVLRHALQWLGKKENFYPDIVLLMEATNPIRRKGLVDEVIEKFITSRADTVLTACPTHGHFWRNIKGKAKRIDYYYKDEKTKLKDDQYLPRQKRAPLYMEDGSVYAIKPSLVRKEKRLGKKVVIVENDELGSIIDIHDQFDWWLATQIISKYKNRL
jgi:CMP-N-acetylneuraminic acid synthetase